MSGMPVPIAPAITVSWMTPLSYGSVSAAPLVAGAAFAAGLVLAALLVLAVQAVITYHRGSARALRIAD